MAEIEFITDMEIYRRVLLEGVGRSRRFLWIGTSDLKDLYIEKPGKMVQGGAEGIILGCTEIELLVREGQIVREPAGRATELPRPGHRGRV